ncbi:tetratricopeptide repeat-containing sensor histidine kinase [Polaribacter porphyrae]|uniref:histidine kinase n=1 Tax=Polaribacter porphyrae TaxID=1137780 RepID=A0A2S7WS89_9FLAO|nr:sensor histidine kinase [Polaribacter porphyrae]PQJ80460.1 hypothetical protein BTO18_15335 [Polaribacter porphyrae]
MRFDLKIFFLLFFLSFQVQGQRKLETKYDSVAVNIARKSYSFIDKQSDSALYYANKGIEYSKKNNSHLGQLLNMENKAIFYEVVKNEYELAAEIYFEAIKIAEEKEKGYLSTLYNNLTILFTTAKNYDKAEFYGKKAVETSIKKLGYMQEESALINLGIAQSLKKEYNKANKNFDKALSLKKVPAYEASDYYKNVKNDIYYRIAKNYKEQEKYKKAQELFIKTIALDSLKGQRTYSENYMQLIENSILMKDRNVVEKYLPLLNKSIENERSLNNKKEAFKTLALVYNFLGETKKAYEYQEKLLATNDSLNVRLGKKQINELETQYQTKKKEEQIIEEQSKRELWTYISIFAFIVLIFVAVLLYKNSQKRKQLNANKIELEKLLNQRNMLLRETHHRVKNSFQMVSSLLQLQAQGSEAEVAVTALDSAVERVNSMIVLHQQLYAKDNFLGVDLQTYIKDLVTEINTSYADENINFNTNISSIIVDIDTATSLGLLVNELATNSIKYAWKNDESDKIITIKLEEKENEIYFTMFDNGVTKKTKSTQQNYGSELIEILVERLEATQKTLSKNDFGLHMIFNKHNG